MGSGLRQIGGRLRLPNQCSGWKMVFHVNFRANDHQDHCDTNLFKFLNHDVIQNRPIFSKFFCLLDNYISEIGI